MSKIKVLLLFGCLLAISGIKAQVMDSPPTDGVFEKIHVKNRKPIPWTPMREADAFWSKRIWRVIDMREKINHPFYYPINEQNGRRSLMTVLLDAMKEGSLTAYEGGSEEFLVPLTYKDMMKNLTKSDTQHLTRTTPPYEPYDTVVPIEFDPSMVKQFRLKEDWFIDKQRSVMDVRILGICPILEVLDENGELKGYKPLFWIYFPEARQILANSEVFNRQNDAERRSFDDIFYKRMFSSYIYKEANVYDRYIANYATGMDALLESERIKDDIFKVEHDLWEY